MFTPSPPPIPDPRSVMDNHISLTFLFGLNGQATQALSCPNLHSLVRYSQNLCLYPTVPRSAESTLHPQRRSEFRSPNSNRISQVHPSCAAKEQRNSPQDCSFKVTMTRFDANTSSIHTYKSLNFSGRRQILLKTGFRFAAGTLAPQEIGAAMSR